MTAGLNAADAPESLRLWPGDAPGLAANPGQEVAEAAGRVSNVSVPMLDVYLPPRDKANGTAIIIVSGGGYGRLASGPLGQGAAKLFGEQGYAVFSLKYRTRKPSTDILKDAVADGAQAMRIVRSHAKEWGIDPQRVGMVGFSAGANLILNLATTGPEDARPDFVGLAATWHYNQKSGVFKIDAKTPPAFFMHAADDETAKRAFTEDLVGAWKTAGVPVELLSSEKGGHMAFNSFPKDNEAWPALFTAWLGKIGKVGAAK